MTGSLERLDAAGAALRWIRQAASPHVPEPDLWNELVGLLDRLDTPSLAVPPSLVLAEAGIRILKRLGYQINLEQCVKCGRACDKKRSAYVDAFRGGVVCRACGGAPLLLNGPTRRWLVLAADGQTEADDKSLDVPVALGMIDAVLRAHAGVREQAAPASLR